MTRVDWSRELSHYRCEAVGEKTRERCKLTGHLIRDHRRVCCNHERSKRVQYVQRPEGRRSP